MFQWIDPGKKDKKKVPVIDEEDSEKLKKFRSENKTFSREAADDLLMFVDEWILTHIIEDDQKLGKHILAAENSCE